MTRARDYATVFRAAAKGYRWDGQGQIKLSDLAHIDAMARAFNAIADVFDGIAKVEERGEAQRER